MARFGPYSNTEEVSVCFQVLKRVIICWCFLLLQENLALSAAHQSARTILAIYKWQLNKDYKNSLKTEYFLCTVKGDSHSFKFLSHHVS